MTAAQGLPAGWVTPAVEAGARALAAEAGEEWASTRRRDRISYRVAAYRRRHMHVAEAL